MERAFFKNLVLEEKPKRQSRRRARNHFHRLCSAPRLRFPSAEALSQRRPGGSFPRSPIVRGWQLTHAHLSHSQSTRACPTSVSPDRWPCRSGLIGTDWPRTKAFSGQNPILRPVKRCDTVGAAGASRFSMTLPAKEDLNELPTLFRLDATRKEGQCCRRTCGL